MEKATRVRRIEIQLNEDGSYGAQGTFVTGLMDGDRFEPLSEVTRGLNCGEHPEYEQTLAEIIGEAFAASIAAHDRLSAARQEWATERDAILTAKGQVESELALVKLKSGLR